MKQDKQPKLVDRLVQSVMDWAVDIVRLQRLVKNWLAIILFLAISCCIGAVAIVFGLLFANVFVAVAIFGFGIWGLIVGYGWREGVEEWKEKHKEAEERSERLRKLPSCNRNPIIFLPPKEAEISRRNKAFLAAIVQFSVGVQWLAAKEFGKRPLSKEVVEELNNVAEDLGIRERFTFFQSKAKQSCQCEYCRAYRRRVYFEGSPIYNSGHPEPKDRKKYLDRIAEIDNIRVPSGPAYRFSGQPVDPAKVFIDEGSCTEPSIFRS